MTVLLILSFVIGISPKPILPLKYYPKAENAGVENVWDIIINHNLLISVDTGKVGKDLQLEPIINNCGIEHAWKANL
jgi:hypothetical protein